MKLSISTKESIAKAAAIKAFDARKKAAIKSENALAIKAYNHCFDKKTRDAVGKVPDKWLQEDNCLRFNANGWNVTLCLKKDETVRVPSSHGCQRLGDITGELAEQMQAHATEKQKIESDFSGAYHKILGFVQQFNTMKKLREAWPEGREFYAKFDVEPDKNGLPAVIVGEINQLIGLKSKAV